MSAKSILILTILSTLLVTVMFLGGDPSSLRGFYYIFWLWFWYFSIWKHRDTFSLRLQRLPFWGLINFLILGILMILMEETIAGTMVHILQTHDISSLWAKILQYYANNLLLLSGYIIGWYFLLRRYTYSLREIIFLVGIFGLYAEKIYVHVLAIPILGIPLVLPTVFTYFFILYPSILSLTPRETIEISRPKRYLLWIIVPLIASVPLILIHTYLSWLWYIDPTILTK